MTDFFFKKSLSYIFLLISDVKHYNIEAYKQDLVKVLQNQPQDDDPNTLWKEWKEKFLLVANMHAPPVTRRVRSGHAPWLIKLTSIYYFRLFAGNRYFL